MSGGDESTDFGVYVHIPFCSRRCDYCAFATWTDRDHLIEEYVDAVCLELERAVASGDLVTATSVFFGGGTPSLIPGELLMRILDRIPLSPEAEVTVECNPDTVTAELAEIYFAGGVNRVSFGVQSMVPHVLEALGRTHDPASVARAVGFARQAGFVKLNLDLIYGGAGESLDDWCQTLDAVIALAPTHVSAYALTIEPGTPLASDPARHPDDDDQADKYLAAEERLRNAGLLNYEISNWAVPGDECRHNELYWAQGDYLGFGCAAHSHRQGRRWWNVRTPDRYIETVAAGESTEASFELLDPQHRHVEGLRLALRTNVGVPVDALSDEDRALLEPLLEEAGGRLHLTVDGRLLANEVAVRLR
jgi:oxygen-independent coproporphyrinogen-3 oxidase